VSRIACVGETFVDLLAETEIADVGASEFFQRAAGGAVSNVAIGIARLGGDVAFVGTVGRDPFGRFLVRVLAHENVGIDGLRTVDAPTSVILVARGPDGARDFHPLNCPGAESLLCEDDLDRAMLANARCIHFGGVVLAAEPGRSACMSAARIGARNALVSFDPNVRPKIFSDCALMRRVILEACDAAHLVKCSGEDLHALGIDDRDPVSLLRGATRAAVVTDGHNGCRWATADGGAGSAVAPRISPVDTTGAGDAFMAALLWRLCHHHQAKVDAPAVGDAVRWAVVAGALACEKEGAIASLPRLEDLEAMLQSVR
jgi:fructokinase